MSEVIEQPEQDEAITFELKRENFYTLSRLGQLASHVQRQGELIQAELNRSDLGSYRAPEGFMLVVSTTVGSLRVQRLSYDGEGFWDADSTETYISTDGRAINFLARSISFSADYRSSRKFGDLWGMGVWASDERRFNPARCLIDPNHNKVELIPADLLPEKIINSLGD